jgi:uncharacterized DUF497 family protein
MTLTFEWDEGRARENHRKHGVTFEEAKTVFGDPHSLTIADPVHSLAEDRFVDIGRSAAGRILVVVYTERGQRVRLISSRRATPLERSSYEQGRHEP